MPRIPVSEGPRVAPRPVPTPYSNLNQDTGGGELLRGLEQLGQGMENLGASVQRARDRADTIAVTDAETRFQHEITGAMVGRAGEQPSAAGGITPGATPDPNAPEERPTAFLSTRGVYAGEKAEPTFSFLAKRRREIADELTSERQKELFRKRSAGQLEDANRRMQAHVAQQTEEAAVASLKARTEAALTDIATNPDDETADRQRRALIGPIRMHQLSKEDGDERIAALDREIAKTRLNQYLARGDWRSAETLFGKVKDQLGHAGTQIQKAISQMRLDREGEELAAKLVESARDPTNGRVDSARALAGLDKVPEGPLRDEARQRTEHRVDVEAKAWKQQVDSYFSRAFTGYLKSGGLSGIDSRDKSWLIDNAPEEWRKLQMMARQDALFARARAGRGGGMSEDVSQALLELKADLVDNRDLYDAMSTEEFTNRWGPRLRQSPAAWKAAGTLFAQAKKDKPETATEFNRFVQDEVRGTPMLQGPNNKKRADQFRALMGDARRGFVEKNKREPTLEELGALRDSVWTTEKSWWGLGSDRPVLKKREEGPAYGAPDAGTPEPPAPAAAVQKAEVIDPKTGQRGLVPEAKVDAWLSAHPTFRRR